MDETRVIGENLTSGGSGGEFGPGAIVGEYVIRAVLAAGGHGTVYEAEHRVLGRRAAIKILHQHLTTQGEMLARFVREARVVNQIGHPNIVDVYDYGRLPDGSPYYVMELLGGTTLSTTLQLRGRLSPQRALSYLEPVCAALEAAHRQGVVHRDLKASNIAVVEEGEVPRVKLLDFGIAKLIQPEGNPGGLTVAGQRLGTPYAMAPEQIRGIQVDCRTDVYALGVLLFQLLTGEYPFKSHDDLEVERMHLTTPPPRPSLLAPVPPAVDAVVLRSMEKEPERRYQDVRGFLEALRQAVGAGADPKDKAAATWTATAIAVYVELALDDAAHEDDEVLARVSDILTRAEGALKDANFLVPLQTGNAALGVRVLSVDPDRSTRERRQALEVANLLHGYANEVTDGRIQVQVCLHVDKAVVRRGSAGLEVLGGPIARTADWVVRDGNRLAMTSTAASTLNGLR
ncbi:MAG TPA: serine/threonine-protein kinase [Myxococcaceae bacterium]|nr:serine/threonine-protein kinase [Myxococcaceae bacterium]